MTIDFDAPPANPVPALETWIEDGRAAGLPNPNAMTLCTIDPDGRPSARIVLLKGLDDRGAVFYTNRTSRKGQALEANKVATLVFHWDPLERQAIIEGNVTWASDEESDAYFATRPRASQIGAWASLQSTPVSSREELDAAFEAAEAKFEGGDVPRPPHWGGYRVSLERITIWQGRPFRLHDRIEYRKVDGEWRVQRLYP